MKKNSLLFILLIVLTHPTLTFASEEMSIFKRLDNSKVAKVTEYTCDNETLKSLPFAEICEMRDGSILTFSPYEICEGYNNYPDCTYNNIKVFNRSSSVYIKHNNVFYAITNTLLCLFVFVHELFLNHLFFKQITYILWRIKGDKGICPA